MSAGVSSAAPPALPSGSSSVVDFWGPPTDPNAAVARAGLPMLSKMYTDFHYHAHLDVFVDGRQITVPALIGIDDVARRGSPLHTHDTSGIIHIESETDIPFTLGQFFTEWDEPLTATQVGPVLLTPFGSTSTASKYRAILRPTSSVHSAKSPSSSALPMPSRTYRQVTTFRPTSVRPNSDRFETRGRWLRTAAALNAFRAYFAVGASSGSTRLHTQSWTL
ncbi:hypothetical protein ACLMAL_32215 [Nocardia sp. CWNU-33]|uniref:hypothetical protein n=1 Tax=Nocardia sp. CWNU-33 TaxID=3392117 RepID=UPI00398EDDAD